MVCLNRYILNILICILLGTFLFSCDKYTPDASSKSDTFVKMFGGVRSQYGSDIQITPDGGYIILGSSSSFDQNDLDLYLVKVDLEGNEEWSRKYGSNKDDYGNALLVDRDGDYILLGTTTNEVDSTDILILKVNKQGEQVWERKIGDRSFNERGTMIKEDMDGNGYILVGTTNKLDNGKYTSTIPESDVSDALIVRIDLQGNVDLSRTQGSNGPDIIHDVVLLKNSSGADEYAFVGTTTNFSEGQSINGSNILFFKFNKSLGSNVEITHGGDKNDTGNSLCHTFDGGFAVVGSTLSFGNGGEDIFMVQLKLNKDNEVTNRQHFSYGGGNDDKGVSIQQLQDGSFIILGTTNSYGSGGADIYLLKVGANGEEIWSRTFGDEGNESASRVILTPDGGFAIVGTVRFGNNDMMYLVKTNSQGLLYTLKD